MNNKTIENDNLKFPVDLILNITDLKDITTIFRLSSSLGVRKIYVTDKLSMTDLKKIAKGTKIEYEITNIIDCLKKLKEAKVNILALDFNHSSTPVHQYPFHVNENYAFVVGDSTDSEISNKITEYLHIEIFGQNSRINIATATGIAIAQYLSKIKS